MLLRLGHSVLSRFNKRRLGNHNDRGLDITQTGFSGYVLKIDKVQCTGLIYGFLQNMR